MEKTYEKINEILLDEDKPSLKLEKMLDLGELNKEPFLILDKLKDIPQELKHHPEGNVWNHLMLVIDKGAKYKRYSCDKRAFMWALLLHDIGKVNTTKIRKGRITSYDHDKVGAKMALDFFEYFKEENKFIKDVVALVRWHMQILFIINKLPFSNINDMINQVELKEISLISLCDRLGRGSIDEKKIKETYEDVQKFVDIISESKGIEKFDVSKELS